MADHFSVVIEEIKNLPAIASNSEIVRHLQLINKFAETDQERAYLLGCVLKRDNNSALIPSENKKALLLEIKSLGLEDYYYLHEKPEKEHLDILSIFFFLAGLVLLIFGIIKLSNDDITLNTNLRYLTTMVKNGGYQIILGILLLTGGCIRYRHELKKKRIVLQLSY